MALRVGSVGECSSFKSVFFLINDMYSVKIHIYFNKIMLHYTCMLNKLN